MKKNTSGRHGFTLVELLVVIGIIAVLIAILLPTLNKARRAAQETQCMSNLRQFAIGFQMYADLNKGALPQDGPDGSDKGTNLIGKHNALDTTARASGVDDPSLFYNAVAVSTQNQSYYTLIQNDMLGKSPLPSYGDNSLFVCPSAYSAASFNSADSVADGRYFLLWGTDPTHTASPYRFKFYLSYVFNSMLFTTANDGVTYDKWKISQLRPTSSCVLMVEKLENPGEYAIPSVQAAAVDKTLVANASGDIQADGYHNKIGQPKANWKRFTTRHRGGGHVLFADGHVAWYQWRDLQPKLNPYNPGAVDANQPGNGLIWNPRSGVGTKNSGD